MEGYIPTETTIERVDPAEPGPRNKDWKVGFTRRYDEKSSSTNVEWMSQGELITLWQQIGALFNLAGMREGLTNADLAKMGIKR